MTDLPLLKPLKPIAICEVCGSNIYENTASCRANFKTPDDCPLSGEQFRQLRRHRDLLNFECRKMAAAANTPTLGESE